MTYVPVKGQKYFLFIYTIQTRLSEVFGVTGDETTGTGQRHERGQPASECFWSTIR